jgi:hypothetical protein
MKRMSSMASALFTLIALNTIVTAVAQAEEAPYWSIEGTRLTAGRTAEATAKPKGSKVFTAGTIEVTCTGGELEKGAVIIGSEPGEPGKSEGVIRLTGCTVRGNGEPCEVSNKEVVTETLVGELAYAANKKSLVGLSTPKKGKVFTIGKFTGMGCKETEAAVRGSIVGGIYTDAEPPVLLELPTAVVLAKSFVGKSVVTSRSKIWVIKGGVGSEVETEELTAMGHEAELAGTDLASLTSGKNWAPEL